MNVLQEMGIQQWRLRGRKSVSSSVDAASPEPSHALESESSALSNTDLGNVGEVPEPWPKPLSPSHVAPDTEEPNHIVSNPSSVVSGTAVSSDKLSDSHTSTVLSADQRADSAVDNDAQPEVTQVHASDTDSAIGVESVKNTPPVGDDIVMPSLRPAPVPFEPPMQVDLTIAEPASPPAGIDVTEPHDEPLQSDDLDARPLSPDLLDHAVLDQAPQYHDADIPTETVGVVGDSDVDDEGMPHQDLGWRELQRIISGDQVCPSCGPHKSALGFGDVLADWMFISDALTTAELQAQQLFVGRAGQLFDAVLNACGLQRDEVYSTTIFKCSPPDDLSLSPQCNKVIRRQIELVQPKVIIAFGEFVAQSVLRANEGFDLLRKGRHVYPGVPTLVVPTYMPQQLLANPALKAEVWQELKLAMQSLA